MQMAIKILRIETGRSNKFMTGNQTLQNKYLGEENSDLFMNNLKETRQGQLIKC